MKRSRLLLSLCAALLLSVCASAVSEGLFPSFNTIFTQLPSLSAVVKRRADLEEDLVDGSRRVTYNNITNADFDKFSRYIQEYGCELISSTNDNSKFVATIRYSDATFVFEYEFARSRAIITYPSNANEEQVDLSTPSPTPRPTATPRPITTPRPTVTPTKRPTATPTRRPTATPQKVSLEIVPGKDATGWHWISSRLGGIQILIKNTHPSKTVHDYTVVSYTCDEFRNQNSAVKEQNIVKKVKPYETAETPDIRISNPEQASYIYIAIKSVRYEDGTTETTNDPVYFSWH